MLSIVKVLAACLSRSTDSVLGVSFLALESLFDALMSSLVRLSYFSNAVFKADSPFH